MVMKERTVWTMGRRKWERDFHHFCRFGFDLFVLFLGKFKIVFFGFRVIESKFLFYVMWLWSQRPEVWQHCFNVFFYRIFDFYFFIDFLVHFWRNTRTLNMAASTRSQHGDRWEDFVALCLATRCQWLSTQLWHAIFRRYSWIPISVSWTPELSFFFVVSIGRNESLHGDVNPKF